MACLRAQAVYRTLAVQGADHAGTIAGLGGRKSSWYFLVLGTVLLRAGRPRPTYCHGQILSTDYCLKGLCQSHDASEVRVVPNVEVWHRRQHAASMSLSLTPSLTPARLATVEVGVP
jgi:hypothetical protein